MVGDDLVRMENLTIRYGDRAVVRDVTLAVPRNGILGIVGPAGSGKSSLLTALNRTIDLHPSARVEGRVTLDGTDVRQMELSDLRRRVAMVLPLPVGLPFERWCADQADRAERALQALLPPAARASSGCRPSK